MTNKINVGIIGCGNISDRYFEWCAKFDILHVAGCADIDMSRAEAKAQQYNVKAYTVEGLLADPDIQIVVNLTIPQAHAQVDLAAIAAGKSVHSEKPLALNREDGQQILQAAADKGVLVGCAPDTFLGGGLQTCRKLIDDGWIGTPVAATAFMVVHGHESWHPNPEFYYKAGGGPMLDMGPYYLTALVHLLGPVKRVTGSSKTTFPTRTITSKPLYGTVVDVDVTTHLAATLDFASGAIATVIMSFDVWSHNLPRLEIYGSEGSMSVPDPNNFGGPVKVRRAGADAWSEIPLSHSADVQRGIGVADMAYALSTGRQHRASGELAYHVLDVMLAVDEASQSGQHIDITSTVERPAPLPLGLLKGQLDD
ncbi:MAG: oxidoreductase [Anaerolineaceae bacterium]|nr:oxidoreductase [Anaerolineaceae bacterium]